MNTKKLLILGAVAALLFAGSFISPQKAEALAYCDEFQTPTIYPLGSISIPGYPTCESTQSEPNKTCTITVPLNTQLGETSFRSDAEPSSYTMESWPYAYQQYHGPCGRMTGCLEGRPHTPAAITSPTTFGLTMITHCMEAGHTGPLGPGGSVRINVLVQGNPDTPPNPPNLPPLYECDFDCNLVISSTSTTPNSQFTFDLQTSNDVNCNLGQTGEQNRKFSVDTTGNGRYDDANDLTHSNWTNCYNSFCDAHSPRRWTARPYSASAPATYTATGKVDWRRNSNGTDGIVTKICTAPVTITSATTHLACVNNSCASVPGAGTNTCSPVGSACDPELPDPTVDLIANPTTVNPGATSTLRWSSTNAISCSGGVVPVGNPAPPRPTSSSPFPTAALWDTTTWSITCLGVTGTTPATDTATVTVRKLLEITKDGTGTGRVTGDPSGYGSDDINCGSNCEAPFNSGIGVTLTALPDAGSVFSGWSGDCSGTAVTASVTMNADKTCNATFDTSGGGGPYTLNVTKTGTGSGRVTGNPAGNNNDDIDCGGNCGAPFDSGRIVTLTATPSTTPASVFSGWSGDCSGTANATSVTMNATKFCNARFDTSTHCAATSTINVVSNISARWAITGPENFYQNTSTTNASYATHNTGTYTLVAGPVAGYTSSIAPVNTQTITTCPGSLNFNITYTPGNPTRYACNSGGSCIASSTGSYTTSNCNNSCSGNPTRYACNSGGSCIASSTGSYTTSDCNNSCGGGNPTRYACNSGGSCIASSTGSYTTSNCNNSCGGGNPTRYACNSGGSCIASSTGSYTTSDCNNSCGVIPPSAPACTFTAAPKLISRGGSSELTWSCTGVTSCAIRNLTTNVTVASNGPAGQVIVRPTSTTPYGLNCTDGSFATSTTVRVRTLQECNPGDPTCNPVVQ